MIAKILRGREHCFPEGALVNVNKVVVKNKKRYFECSLIDGKKETINLVREHYLVILK